MNNTHNLLHDPVHVREPHTRASRAAEPFARASDSPPPYAQPMADASAERNAKDADSDAVPYVVRGVSVAVTEAGTGAPYAAGARGDEDPRGDDGAPYASRGKGEPIGVGEL